MEKNMTELYPELKVFNSKNVLLLNNYHGLLDRPNRNYDFVIYTCFGEALNESDLSQVLDFYHNSKIIVVTPRYHLDFYYDKNRCYIVSIPSSYAWYSHNISKCLISYHDREFKKKFLSLNNRAQWTRHALFQFLVKYNLLDQFYFSYHFEDRFNVGTKVLFDNTNQIIGKTWFNQGLDVEKLFNMLPVTTNLDNFKNNDWGEGNSLYYRQSFCSLVTETYIDENYDVFFTEKTFKPIAYGHPFLLCSSAGALKTLHDLGFKTFDDVFDETYDDIENPQLRFEHILQEIIRICSMTEKEINKLYNMLIPRLKHNQEVFYNELSIKYNHDMVEIVDRIDKIIHSV